MKLKTAIWYRYEKYLKIMGLFFGLLIIPVVGGLVASRLNNYEIFVPDAPFLFVLCCIMSFVFGVTSYKSVLKFFLQNGVSRQSAHMSFLMSLPIGVILAVAESIVHTVVTCISELTVNGQVTNAGHTDIFSHFFFYQGGMLKIFIYRIIIEALAFMMLLSLGYLISAIFSSMKPFYKLIVVIVLTATIIFSFIISAISDSYASLGIPNWLAFLCFFVFGGIGSFYMSHFVASMIILTVLFSSISQLIIRKAVIRK